MRRERILVPLLWLAFGLPVLYLGIMAFAGRWPWPSLLPTTWSLRTPGWMAAQGAALVRALLSSAAYSLASTALAFALSLPAAEVLVRRRFPGREALRTLLMIPVLVPSITFAMGAHRSFLRLGLADSAAGIVLVLTAWSYPYMLRALMNGYRLLGPRYAVTARQLGAGPLQVRLGVELPLLMPAAVSGGSIVFLVAFSEYFLVFLIGGGAVPSYTGYLVPFLLSSDRPVASGLSLLFLAVPILLFYLTDTTVNRYYRKRGML